MDSTYNFKDYEQKIYDLWEKGNFFSPDSYQKNSDQDRGQSQTQSPDQNPSSFAIMMPPPNANDPLHIGHAMFIAIEDILIRWQRMRGLDTLWLPGTDHAGIETQFVFEKKLAKKDQSRFDFDRETLYQMIWDYVQENSQVATTQMKKIGASADWSRFKFMLDPKIVEVVLTTFAKLHQEGLVYRDLKLVNYCTKCGTSYSELEVEHQEKTDALYTIQYGPLQVSTVRPETLFGDVALAVNPDDSRYKNAIGQTITANFPWGEIKLPVLGDEYVKTDFGTGVLKITPYHDPNDYEVWQRHLDQVEQPQAVINHLGKTTSVPAPFNNLSVNKAREAVVAALEDQGLIIKKEPYIHSIGTCYRCKRTIEPLPLPQFFIKVEPLVKPILQALADKKLIVHGAGHDKILKHWLENLKDWNISRQIVWGIRLPIWYDVDQNPDIQVVFISRDKKTINGLLGELLTEGHQLEEIRAGLQTLNAAATAQYVVSPTLPDTKSNWIQETDTFDTWFSSAQWPFSTLKASDQPGDFERFYPTQVMETGYDILPFWVMRMLMVGQFATGQLPFDQVYLHGLVRDQKGQKMSKSKGNVINPLAIIDQYSADALRMALVIRSSAGLDKSVGEGDFKAMRNFTNKIWNAARYVSTSLNEPIAGQPEENQAFLDKMAEVEARVSQQLQDFKIGQACETVYEEFWHWYCDICIEKTKKQELSSTHLRVGLERFLVLLHPFVPFVSEAVYQELHHQPSQPLIAQRWPL